MGEYGGILIALGILFTIGFIVPLIITSAVDTTIYNQDSFITPFIDLVDNGITMDWVPLAPDFDINIFALFGTGFKDFMVTQLNAFSYIPNIIALPLLIIAFVLFVIGIIGVFI